MITDESIINYCLYFIIWSSGAFFGIFLAYYWILKNAPEINSEKLPPSGPKPA
jgi:hypothetical protein